MGKDTKAKSASWYPSRSLAAQKEQVELGATLARTVWVW